MREVSIILPIRASKAKEQALLEVQRYLATGVWPSRGVELETVEEASAAA